MTRPRNSSNRRKATDWHTAIGPLRNSAWGGVSPLDEAMMAADYASGDPYVAFARRGSADPTRGTKDSHPIVRDQCKVLELGLNYGMTDHGLAQRLDVSEAEARYLSGRHQQAYPRFWAYAEQVVHTGAQGFILNSVFGFRRHIDANVQPRSLRNWPMQTNGGEMMRLATVAGIDAGLSIVALVHDALLLLAPLSLLKEQAQAMRAIMVRASEIVTGGFPLRVDVKLIRHPERYADPRGAEMWNRAMAALRRRESREEPPGGEDDDEGVGEGVGEAGQVAVLDPADDGDPADEPEGLTAFGGEWR